MIRTRIFAAVLWFLSGPKPVCPIIATRRGWWAPRGNTHGPRLRFWLNFHGAIRRYT